MKKLLLLALIGSFTVFAQVRPPKPADKNILKLAWDYAQGETPAVKFRVYYGTTAGSYIANVDTAGLEQTAQLDLPAGTYYLTATAVDADGLESLPAPEITATIKKSPASPNNLTTTRITILVD